jgi:hypothetical protein
MSPELFAKLDVAGRRAINLTTAVPLITGFMSEAQPLGIANITLGMAASLHFSETGWGQEDIVTFAKSRRFLTRFGSATSCVD